MDKTVSRAVVAMTFMVSFTVGCGLAQEEMFGQEPTGELEAAITYDADVANVRNYIQNNCGGIVSSGSLESTTHSDVFLNVGKYCDCYSKLWTNRASGSFANVQIIYHEPQSCTNAKHIHIKKIALCGKLHYDIDERSDGNCTHEVEDLSQVDRYTNSSTCGLARDSRVGTCNE